jgi:hypothetical protein
MNTNNRESLLFALAKRLLSGSEPNDVQLLVGELPENLPVELPLPQNHQLLGSLILPQRRIKVVFDTEDNPEQVLRFYRSTLLPQGWQELESLSNAGGFQQTMTNERLFCRGEQEPALIIYAYDLLEQPT